MKWILFLIPFIANANQLTIDRWLTLSDAQAFACPASEALIGSLDDCQLSSSVCVPVDLGPCEYLSLSPESDTDNDDWQMTLLTYEMNQAAQGATPTLTSGNINKIPHTKTWGTNGQALVTDGVGEADWEDTIPFKGLKTTTERNALTPTAGDVVYNTTVNKYQAYDGTTWQDFW